MSVNGFEKEANVVFQNTELSDATYNTFFIELIDHFHEWQPPFTFFCFYVNWTYRAIILKFARRSEARKEYFV